MTISKLGIFETDTPGEYKSSLNKRINQDKAHYWIPRIYNTVYYITMNTINKL